MDHSTDFSAFATIIDQAWEQRDTIGSDTMGGVRDAVDQVLLGLDSGELQVAERFGNQGWQVNEWAKKAILLSFRLAGNTLVGGGYDKVPLKFADWDTEAFAAKGFRAVPGAIVRRGAYIAPDAVLMPSFVNIGAHVGAGTMIDSWATVGSCAQIGANCHISSGVVIGGVLEPLQSSPVIVEDDCFIGANCAVTEGVIVHQGAVIAMGVQISASTKIVDRERGGEILRGKIPAYSVVVPGMLPPERGTSLACAVIVKRVDAATRAKTSVNDLLRN